MKVSWVVSQIVTANVDSELFKSVGPLWGSWKTWKNYKTDNIVCTDLTEAKSLMQRAMHTVANFYVPREFYADLGRPAGLKLFEGQFKGPAHKNKDDVVALNLTAQTSDIVLMYGFDLKPIETMDKVEKVIEQAYQMNIRSVIRENLNVQFVLVDYHLDLAKVFTELENLTVDEMQAVIEMLL